MTVTVSDASSGNATGQLHRFKLYRGGKFIHSKKADGGRLFGCRTFGPQKGLSEYLNAEPIETNAEAVIWRIDFQNICGGNTWRSSSHYITLWNGEDEYHEHTIRDYKWLVWSDSAANHHTIYYREQDWGSGGTATSIYIPRKYVIRNGSGWRYPEDSALTLEEILKFDEVNFLELFESCIQQKLVEFCEYALKHKFDETELSQYEGFFGWGNSEGSMSKITFYRYIELLKKQNKTAKKMSDLLH